MKREHAGNSDWMRIELERIVRAAPWLLDVLTAVHEVGPPMSYVAAGAIRNTVWNALHGFRSTEPAGDIDIVYLDSSDPRSDYEIALQSRLPQYSWEVTNQATVHQWQSAKLGRNIASYSSLAESIRVWPETATAVAVSLDTAGAFDIVAPHGLDDLFAMTVRPSPFLLDREAYQSRIRSKRWSARWPKVTVVPLHGRSAHDGHF